MIKGFTTKALHGNLENTDGQNALRFPVYDSVSFEFESSKDLEGAFNKQKPAHAYSRTSNPTVGLYEQRVNFLAGGTATLALSSGMAAISNLFLAIAGQGKNVVTTKHLFGNTYSFFKTTLKRWGLQVKFTDFSNPWKVKEAVDSNTVALFVETISNPQMTLYDMEAIGKTADDKGIVFIIDNTLCTPYLFKGKEWGVNIEVISSTKYISGGGTSIGGTLIDYGNFDWSRLDSFKEDYRKFGKFSLIKRLRDEVFRNMGSCLSPHNAYLQTLGLETLALRIDKSSTNALTAARFLEKHPSVETVNYPGLESSAYFKIAEKYLPKGCGGLLTFNLKDRQECFRVMDKLKVVRRATNLNDNKSLIIHPASTIYCEFDRKTRESLGVPDNLIRLSVGIEDPEDLIEDFKQALGG